jgi:hypothetical protein
MFETNIPSVPSIRKKSSPCSITPTKSTPFPVNNNSYPKFPSPSPPVDRTRIVVNGNTILSPQQSPTSKSQVRIPIPTMEIPMTLSGNKQFPSKISGVFPVDMTVPLSPLTPEVCDSSSHTNSAGRGYPQIMPVVPLSTVKRNFAPFGQTAPTLPKSYMQVTSKSSESPIYQNFPDPKVVNYLQASPPRQSRIPLSPMSNDSNFSVDKTSYDTQIFGRRSHDLPRPSPSKRVDFPLAFQPTMIMPQNLNRHPIPASPREESRPETKAPSPATVGGGRPNYSTMSVREQLDMRVVFKHKFQRLRTEYPDWGIQDPLESYSLDQIHDVYENIIKSITISYSSSQKKIYLVLGFYLFEIFGTHVLGLNMKGYGASQCNALNKYDSLMMELGEKYYIQGAGNWPIEARLLFTVALNALIFIAIKWIGGKIGDGADTVIQNIVDKLINNGEILSKKIQRDEMGLTLPPVPGNSNADALGNIMSMATQAMSGKGDLMKTVTGAFNGEEGGLNGLLSTLGGLFGGDKTKEVKQTAPTVSSAPKPKRALPVF